MTSTPAGARPRSGPPPFISVVVPVRNEALFIDQTLNQLLSQNYDKEHYEVLVADGQSTDDTAERVRELQAAHGNLRLLDNPAGWSSAGRNRAVEAARGDIVVVVDGHCELDGPNYLLKLAEAFERSGADCVGRPQPLDGGSTTPLQRAIANARSCLLGHHHESFVYSQAERFVRAKSVAVAYRRAVFDQVGLFDESFDACEDVELNHRVDRAGLRCFFTPSVRVHYQPRATLSGLFHQMHRYGRGRMRLLRKHPETFTLAGFLPAVFTAGVVVGLALAAAAPWFAPVYAGALALYALVLLAVSVVLSWRAREPQQLLWLPAVFAAIHTGAGVGLLHECLAPLRGHPLNVRT